MCVAYIANGLTWMCWWIWSDTKQQQQITMKKNDEKKEEEEDVEYYHAYSARGLTIRSVYTTRSKT